MSGHFKGISYPQTVPGPGSGMSHTSRVLGELLDWKGGWLTGTSEYFDTGKRDGGWETGFRLGEEVFLVHSS